MTTRAIFFPFDLFGSAGTKAGAELLADAFQEMLADNEREKTATRARSYAGKVHFEEFTFDTFSDYQDWRPRARKRLRRAMQRNEFLLWVTGNHLAALPLYEELGAAGKKTLVVQLDAHLDVYNLSDCTAELSHGNFLMHAEERLPRIVNVGHRELLLPAAHLEKYYHAIFAASAVAIDEAGVFGKLRTLLDEAERVWIDLDCDAFDPAFFPAVQAPRPFGLTPAFVLRLLDVIGPARLAGLAISEFDPSHDERDRSLETLMWLIEYLLLQRYEA